MTIASSNPCLNCSKPVAVGPGRTGKFCSRSCSVSYNNRLSPKRQPENRCESCSKPVRAPALSCHACRTAAGLNVTLGTLRAKATRHAQVYNTLRQRSKGIADALPYKHCVVCLYDKHTEVAHLRALASLPDSTTVWEACRPHNFVLLCPNHHWELDYGNLAD